LAIIASADLVKTMVWDWHVVAEISIDDGLQVGDRAEDAAADAFPHHLGEAVLDPFPVRYGTAAEPGEHNNGSASVRA
jgi:hypothetical protein